MDPWKGVKWGSCFDDQYCCTILGALSNVLGFSLTRAQSVRRGGLAFDAFLH